MPVATKMTPLMSSPSYPNAFHGSKTMKDTDSSSIQKDASIKIRKPYTITKQREKWTEDEHQKFLEALKLYGRAWQNIKEHIGTKTTIQIRSHAQKFFSKLERNGSSNIESSGEIEIPPPRPKRRPNHPYPRKAGSSVSTCTLVVDDAESPRTVCSSFVPCGSPSVADTWPTPTEVVEEVIATKLRLFGASFLVPEKEEPGFERESSPKSEVSVETREIIGSVLRSSDLKAGMSDEMEPTNESLNCDSVPDASSQSSMQNITMSNILKSHIFDHQVVQQMPFPLINMSYLAAFPPPVPVCWQNPVPYTFARMKNDDVNAAAAFAAATASFAVVSAWQAMHVPMPPPVTNDVTVLYSPNPVLKKPEAQAYEHDLPHVNTRQTEMMGICNAHRNDGDNGENPTNLCLDMEDLRYRQQPSSTELPLKNLTESVESRYHNVRMDKSDASTDDRGNTIQQQRIHQSQVPARNLEFDSRTETNSNVEQSNTTSLPSIMIGDSAFTMRTEAREGVDQACRKVNGCLTRGNAGQILRSRYTGTGFVPYQRSLRIGTPSR